LLFGEDGNLHALVADLVDVSLLSLASAVNAGREAIRETHLWMYFYAQEPASFEPTVSPREPFNFEFFGDRLRVRAEYISTDQEPSYIALHQVLARLLRQHGAHMMRTTHQNEFGRVRSFIEFDYASLRGRRVSDARMLADEVGALASAVSSRGALDAGAIEELVLAGRADLLIGQHEHETFEAKGALYNRSTPEGRYELAKDVAAFANSANGGLIVCGLRTRKVRGSDVVQAAEPLELAGVRARDWIKAVLRLVVPAPEGFHIRTHPRSAAMDYVLIVVPSQLEHIKPFLVQAGRRDNGQIVETDITVPTRIGEDTEYSDATALHGMLTAGRVALRHAEEPSSP
jgi:hypothetical protein